MKQLSYFEGKRQYFVKPTQSSNIRHSETSVMLQIIFAINEKKKKSKLFVEKQDKNT